MWKVIFNDGEDDDLSEPWISYRIILCSLGGPCSMTDGNGPCLFFSSFLAKMQEVICSQLHLQQWWLAGIVGVAPQGHLHKSWKKSMSWVTAAFCSPQPVNLPRKRLGTIRTRYGKQLPLWVFTACAGFFLFAAAFLRHDMGWASVYVGRSDAYEVFWWYDFYYSTWPALAFIFDHTACYLLYAVSHGWLCTFVLGVLTP